MSKLPGQNSPTPIVGYDGSDHRLIYIDETGRMSTVICGWDPDALAPAMVEVVDGALKVSASTTSSGGLTDAELRASDVKVTLDSETVAVTGTFWQTTQPVSGPLTDTQLRATAVPVSGTFWQTTQPVSGTVSEARPSSAAVTSQNVSASNVTLLSANANRLGLTVFNGGDKDVYVKFGSTATTSSYTVKILAGGYFEAMPPCYTGRVDAIWAEAGSGAAHITELT